MAILNRRDYRLVKNRISELEHALSRAGVIEGIASHASADLTEARQKALRAELQRLKDDVAAYERLSTEDQTEREIDVADLGLIPIVARISRKLSQRQLAELLELKEQQIQRYESERYIGVSLARYEKILKTLGVEVHPRLNSDWDEQSSSPNEPRIEAEVLREIRKRNWANLPRSTDKSVVAQEIASYIRKSSQLLKGHPLHRRTEGVHSDSSQSALAIWMARVLRVGAEQRAQIRTKFNIADTAWLGSLVELSVYPDGPLRARDLLRDKGILLVTEPALPHTLLDGAALLLVQSTPVIGLTLRHDRIDNFWFTLLHELGHVFLHFNHGLEVGFIDDLDGTSPHEREKEADSFAQSHLLPDEVWNLAPARFTSSSELVKSFAKVRAIHPAIVAGRIRRDRDNYRIFNELIGRGQVRSLFVQPS